MKKYIPNQIEPRWQEKWEESNLHTTDLSKSKKFYVLGEFPFTSGDLHMGHWFTFAGADCYARFKQMQGFNVFFPLSGYDAFGLPAENAAMKSGVHPQDWTLANVERMRKQFKTIGSIGSFDHEIITCLPEYYRWNQWIFLKMLEKGLAYRGKSLSNWCNVCQTVLANEAIEAGTCWRCHSEVEQKEVEQWFLKITAYADRLIWPSEDAEGPERSQRVDWPKALRDGQNNWIGRSEGTLIKFQAQNSDKVLEVFTTRPDTLFGVTFIVISPEHPLLTLLAKSKSKEVEEYINKAKKKSELERKESKEKTGVFTGAYVKHPLSGEDIPVWVADYVLSGYGTGAIMAVPAHDQRDFEFAKKYGLEIKNVIEPVIPAKAGIQDDKKWIPGQARDDKENQAYEGSGVLVNSGEFNGLSSDRAKESITNYLEQHQLGKKHVQYHLRDWSISRQRYWGTPIPIIYCNQCGVVPVPEKDLPVTLPYEVDYTPKGKPPLASNEEWMNVKCPKCGGRGKRETETMDGFVDSSWYFFRYLDPALDTAPFDKDLAKKIMPVDIYFGGAEHTVGHTMYSRFFTKFFHDLGLTDLEEYALRRINHGVVLGPDGSRMSKSRGNVVNPDEEVKKYGADTIRVYLAFFMPYDGTGPWVPERIWGAYRFLERVWNLSDKVKETRASRGDLEMLNKTIKKVTDDIEGIKFNTAVASLMEWLNYLSRKEIVGKEEYKTMLLLLAPFAPHMVEELWSHFVRQSWTSRDKQWSIHQQSWPQFDKKYLEEEEVTVVVQINGKVRDQMVIQKDIVNDGKVVEEKAKESPKIQKFLGDLSANWRIKKVVYIPGKVINFVVAFE